MIFEEIINSLGKDVLISPGLFAVTDVVTKIHTIGNKLFQTLKKQKQKQKQKTDLPWKDSQVKQNFFNFFAKTVAYFESNFSFINSNNFCALK